MINYYDGFMSDDYDKLMELLDQGNVVACYVDYTVDYGSEKKVFRDIAKAKKKERYNITSPNYGYVVEARGIRYIDWDRNREKLQFVTFKDECERNNLQFIELC